MYNKRTCSQLKEKKGAKQQKPSIIQTENKNNILNLCLLNKKNESARNYQITVKR